MDAPISRFSRVFAIAVYLFFTTVLSTLAGELTQNVARLSLGARVDDKIAELALISGGPSVGYALPDGQTNFVVSLSKIENIDVVSFVNKGATGLVTIATSNSKLAAGSAQWHEIAKQDLTSDVTRIKVGPSEAKYIKFTFNVVKPGRIADLGVYSTPDFTVANTSFAGDGKDVKDFGEGKEAKEVAEGPAEGPAPLLPDPPPFVFLPELSP